MISKSIALAVLFAPLGGMPQGGSAPGEELAFAVSPNREFAVVATRAVVGSSRVAVRTPGNGVILTLYDQVSDEIIWENEQPTAVRSSHGQRRAALRTSFFDLWIDDYRHVVLRTGIDTIAVFHPDDGARLLEVNVPESFPASDRSAFVRESCRGPIWAANSRWYFLDVEHGKRAVGPRSYFVVRPWWERSIVVDLDAGVIVNLEQDTATAKSHLDLLSRKELLEAIDNADRTWVIDTLARGADSLDGHWTKVSTAAHMAGRLEMKEAVPWLRWYEDWDYVGRSTETWQEFALRQTVQLSLRRLGELPGIHEATQIGDFKGDSARPIAKGASRLRRASNARHLPESMSLKELVRLIGHPDYILDERGRVLDYDIDRGGAPFTLRVTLEEVEENPPPNPNESKSRRDKTELRVSNVERITPPLWRNSDERDIAITNRRFGPAAPRAKVHNRGRPSLHEHR